MKHKIIIILSLLIMGNIPLLADENYYGVAILSHQGNETAYAADNVQAAVDAAVEGDVITFSPGRFKEFTLNKLVYLKTYDWQSINVNLDFPDNTVIENSLFSGCLFQVFVKSNIQSIYFSRCGISLHSEKGVNIGDVTFDRCDVSALDYNEYSVNSLNANNCVISGLYNGENTNTASKFTNCKIDWNFNVKGATFENCIFYDNGPDGAKTIYNCTLNNCLYDSEMLLIGENTQANNSYNMSIDSWDENEDNLTDKGFFGTDGTIVGRYGGVTPYDGTSPKEGTSVWSSGNLKYQDDKLTGTYYINPTR